MPAGYAPAFAIGFSQAGTLAMVDSGQPLPVATQPAPLPAPVPLQGSTAASIQAGPYAPVLDRPVVLTLTGTWQGTVQVRRSVDGGATRQLLTIGGAPWGTFKANACEPVWQETEGGALIYVDIALTSGTLAYRLAQ
jgi:hypothetical protein